MGGVLMKHTKLMERYYTGRESFEGRVQRGVEGKEGRERWGKETKGDTERGRCICVCGFVGNQYKDYIIV